MKRMTMDSATAALCSNDILCEILLRLPPETVFGLILVSKRWLEFICSPFFHSNYMKRWQLSFRLLGFFACNSLYLGRPQNGPRRPQSEPALPFLPTCGEGDDLKFSGMLKQLGYFIDSSKGLVLCGRHSRTYYVWNPITQQRQQLPRPRVFFEELCMAFLVEDYVSENICYKVIRAKCECRGDEIKTIPIETFNSKTSTWHYSTLTCSSTLMLAPWSAATVIKGVVHWYALQGNIAIYDPHHGRKLALIKLPGSDDFDERILGESCDGLLQYGWSNKSGMEIWVLEKENGSYESIFSSGTRPNNGWKMRYRFNFKLMWKKNLKLMTEFSIRNKETQLLSFLPCNSESVYIRAGSDIFICHLTNEKVEVVRYEGSGSSILWDFSKVVPYLRPCWPHSSLCCRENTIT